LRGTVVLTHTRRRWAFVWGLLAAGWRKYGVPRFLFLFFLFFFVVLHVKTGITTPPSVFLIFYELHKLNY
jgi:hypothetical protein